MLSKASATPLFFRSLAVAAVLTLSGQAYAVGQERPAQEPRASDEVENQQGHIVDDGCVILNGVEKEDDALQLAFFPRLPKDWYEILWRA